MAAKPGQRRRHAPQRTCVGCRSTTEKRELIRIVRTPEGVHIDETGKLAGRGAYLHNQRSCWQKGLQGGLAHALKTTLTDEDKQRLTGFLESLPDDEEAQAMIH